MINCKINYLGSKYKLLGFINRVITEFININGAKCADIFSGTTVVSQFFALNGASHILRKK